MGVHGGESTRGASGEPCGSAPTTEFLAPTGTKPIEDDRECTGLQVSIPVGMFGGQAGASQHRHCLIDVDIVSDRTGPLGASQERSERSP